MTTKRESPLPERFSLDRWSKRKLAAEREPASSPADVIAAQADAARPVVPEAAPAAAATQELPPVESLTFDSEFAPFLRPGVDETLKRSALKKLLRDPRFNVMDGLDTYIDDYTKADPIPADMLKQLVQARYIFDPPKTEITPDGHVIDSPVEDAPRQTQEALAAPADPASPEPRPADATASTVAPDSDKR